MRIFHDEPLNREITQSLRQSFGQSEVELADRLRIIAGDFGEWAAMEHEVEPKSSLCPGWTKASSNQICFDHSAGVTAACEVGSGAVSLDAASLAGAQPSTERRAELPGEPRIGSRALPPPGHFRMQTIKEPGSARSIAELHFLRNEIGPLEDGQMLADSVVIQLHQVGELGDAYRPIGIGNVAKEAMACRIAKCTRFRLRDVANRQWVL